ncbi:MAG: HDIG domain-containing protein [Clostridia bacterium]|nr:HDIG domain-containing protein [Clostridia bacterium]
MEKFDRNTAMALLEKYNKEPFHIEHGLAVSKAMEYFAKTLGYENDVEFWSLVGLLHDVDYEKYPDEHCKIAPTLLKEIDASDEFIHAVCSHAYGICSDVEPIHEMEKVLFACDELTGLIGAAARMRPNGISDMELSSLKKKFKDKKFAAGCSRDTIKQGADMLGWELDKLLEETLKAMKGEA